MWAVKDPETEKGKLSLYLFLNKPKLKDGVPVKGTKSNKFLAYLDDCKVDLELRKELDKGEPIEIEFIQPSKILELANQAKSSKEELDRAFNDGFAEGYDEGRRNYDGLMPGEYESFGGM